MIASDMPKNATSDQKVAGSSPAGRTTLPHERDQPMKIESKAFRVREGEKVKLKKWPTKVKPFYKSKEHYQKLLEAHTREMSARQGLFYAHDRYALLVIFQAMDAAGKDG